MDNKKANICRLIHCVECISVSRRPIRFAGVTMN